MKTKGVYMNKLTKAGLTALAGSLAAYSANAADFGVSGSVNMTYVSENNAKLSILDKRTVWLDTGTPQALSQASSYISAIQSNTGEFVACLEEIAWRKGMISKSEMIASVDFYPKDNFYSNYIRGL